MVPQTEEADAGKNWVADKKGHLYNPDRDASFKSGDETIGLDLSITAADLAPASQAGSTKKYQFLSGSYF